MKKYLDEKEVNDFVLSIISVNLSSGTPLDLIIVIRIGLNYPPITVNSTVKYHAVNKVL